MGKIDPKVINQVRLYARNWPKINDLGEKWASQTITHAPKTFKNLKDLIKTEKDFPRKVIRSGLKAAMKFIRTGYINPSGISKKDILSRGKSRLNEAVLQYFIHLKEGFQNIEKTVKSSQSKYTRYTAQYLLPFTGRRGVGKGLGPLAALWLTGNQNVKNYLAETDKIVKGNPVLITNPQKAGQFRKRLINQIIHSGSVILRAMDMDKYVRELRHKDLPVDSELTTILKDTLCDENKRINNLVNRYQRMVFKPFRPGGNSHIDFFVEEIFNESKWQCETKLGLEIQVAG